jgi:hypothetical protein
MHLLYHANKVYGRTSSDLNRTLALYSLDNDITIHWDSMQVNLECCGLKDFTDFLSRKDSKEDSLPQSCCEVATAEKEDDIPETSLKLCGKDMMIKKQGCRPQIESRLFVASSQVGVYLVFAFFMWWVISIVSATVIASLYRHKKTSLPDPLPVPANHLAFSHLPSFSMTSSASRTERSADRL